MKFEISYAVTLDRPVDEVFAALALPDGLERLLRLSPMVTFVTLLDDRPGPTPSTEVVDFQFGEAVPMLPGGLYSAKVTMKVEQTIDKDLRRVDYRSRSKGGPSIYIHKVRTFESLGEGGSPRTKVSEVIHGEAPPGLHLITRRSARKAHIEHMDSYRQLFEATPA